MEEIRILPKPTSPRLAASAGARPYFQVVDVALIGNGSFQALIDSRARVRWLCWPRFDSDFVFAHLLDEERGGSFSVELVTRQVDSEQHYLEDSALLSTTLAGEGFAIEVTDVAPRFQDGAALFRPRHLVRRIVPTEGTPTIRVACSPVANDGSRLLSACTSRQGLRFGEGEHAQSIALASSDHVQAIQNGEAFVLTEPLTLVLSWGDLPDETDVKRYATTCIDKSLSHWQEWIAAATLPGEFRDAVVRSMITLKLHQYEDTGAFSAACTTSIPEHPGSERNWDYRFCWPRDSYFSVHALAALGDTEPARHFVDFIAQVQRLQPIYGLGGELELTERCLELAGYRGDGPVRVGNQAYEQDQHDIYGEILAAAELISNTGSADLAVHDLANALLDAIETNLRSPDAGLWEKRQAPTVHTFSLLMHWVGCGAAMKLAACAGDNRMATRALRLREAARSIIEEECWRAEPGFFADGVQTDSADASLFLLVTTGFLEATDPRARSHVDYLAKTLAAAPHLLYRYRHDDGLGSTHASFTVCSFWYAEALACLGDTERSRTLVTDILAHANHVGLLSEDIDPGTGQLWGNLPQTYSHVGVIQCALALQHASKASKQPGVGGAKRATAALAKGEADA